MAREKQAQGKVWFVDGIAPDDLELAEAQPFNMQTSEFVNPAPATLPVANVTNPRKEGVSRNGFVPDVLLQCVVKVKAITGECEGNAVRCGNYGWTANHVFVSAIKTGKSNDIKLDCGTDTAIINTYSIEEYDLAYFQWPRKASFQAVKSATYASPTTMKELYERKKVAIVAKWDDGVVERNGNSSGVTVATAPAGQKMFADYGTPGGGSSGAPVFTEVSPGVWHLVGIHVEYDDQTERNLFSTIKDELRVRLNSPPPPQK